MDTLRGPNGGKICYTNPEQCLGVLKGYMNWSETFKIPSEMECFRFHYPISIHLKDASGTDDSINFTIRASGACEYNAVYNSTILNKTDSNYRLSVELKALNDTQKAHMKLQLSYKDSKLWMFEG